jgi:hypothetical protein
MCWAMLEGPLRGAVVKMEGWIRLVVCGSTYVRVRLPRYSRLQPIDGQLPSKYELCLRKFPSSGVCPFFFLSLLLAVCRHPLPVNDCSTLRAFPPLSSSNTTSSHLSCATPLCPSQSHIFPSPAVLHQHLACSLPKGVSPPLHSAVKAHIQ